MIARGDIWTAAGGGYSGKPRPAVIIQNDAFIERRSATICLITSVEDRFPLFRIEVQPNLENGLEKVSFCMADKIITVRFHQLGRRIGRLSANDMSRLDQAILVYLGLAQT
jgi:mRNA interferase MazF